MSDAIIAAFLDDVRRLPKFIEAAQFDDKWLQHFEAMETGIQAFAESDDPLVINRYGTPGPNVVDPTAGLGAIY